MPISIPETVNDQSTGVFVVSFLDEDDQPVTPNEDTIFWSLYDSENQVVNDREDVPVDSAEEIDIVLFGNDLVYSQGGAKRKLLVKCLYNSTRGSNLPLREQAEFWISDLVG